MVIIKEKYIHYKKDFTYYVLLFKTGNFYTSINDDAIVLANLLGYKILDSKDFIKVGFPVSSLNKVKNILLEKEINYVVIDKEVIDKKKNKPNKYNDYLNNEYIENVKKINNICETLKKNVNHKNINKIIHTIEKICTKNLK